MQYGPKGDSDGEGSRSRTQYPKRIRTRDPTAVRGTIQDPGAPRPGEELQRTGPDLHRRALSSSHVLSVDHARVADLLPHRHGLGRVDATKLAHALIAFSIEVAEPARWHLPEHAFGECADASSEFCSFIYYRYSLRFLRHQYYFRPSAWTPENDRAWENSGWSHRQAQDDRNRYPYYKSGGHGDHWVSQHGHLMVDWTARQFQPTAPWPALWIDDPNETED